MNKRILLSGISLFSSLALVTGATFAFFSDVGTSTNNVFAAGNLNLQLDDNSEPVSEGVTASFGGTGLVPGGSNTGFVSLHNGGSVAIAEIELGANEVSHIDNSDGTNLANVLDLTIKTGSDNTCTTTVVDHTSAIATTPSIGNGGMPLTLAELTATDYDALPGLAVSADSFVCITATMKSDADNTYQGDSVTTNFTFTANQDASQ